MILVRFISLIYLIVFPIFLFLSILQMNSWYYQFVRWISLILFLYSTYKALSNKYALSGLFFLTLACLFNPILQFYFQKETWVFLDIIAIIGSIAYGISKIILKENI